MLLRSKRMILHKMWKRSPLIRNVGRLSATKGRPSSFHRLKVKCSNFSLTFLGIELPTLYS